MVITIDGPTASGKSVAAHKLAQRINFYHLSSGLLFRALSYLLSKYAGYTEEKIQNPNPEDITYYLDQERFICKFDTTGTMHIYFEGNDIIPFLKHKKFDRYSSIIGINISVRKALMNIQRMLARSYDLVVDGRDSGSVVFPDAVIKFYLTASLEVRAVRWKEMQKALGNDLPLKEAIEQIKSRDERDKRRKLSPLIIPEGAIVIDNSTYSIEGTVEIMLSYVVPVITKA